MRALVQRADGAAVHVDGEQVGGFDGPGLLVLVGVTHSDTAAVAERLAAKVYRLRIFDANSFGTCVVPGGAREISAADLHLPVLVVSQFTLYGDTGKGRRPTWEAAAPGDVAQPLVAAFAQALRTFKAPVSEGSFGAHMRVSLVNDGPITLLLEA